MLSIIHQVIRNCQGKKKRKVKHGSYPHRPYSLVDERVIKYLFRYQYNKKICNYEGFSVASNQSHHKNWNFQVYAIGKSQDCLHRALDLHLPSAITDASIRHSKTKQKQNRKG